MVRQSCSELTEMEFHSHSLLRREIYLAHKTHGSDFVSNKEEDQVTGRKIPKFLLHYVNISKSINNELETFVIDIYVTAYVLSCCRIPHFLASVLTEYVTSHMSVSNYVFFRRVTFRFRQMTTHS
jgi:hypothetical protein